MARKPNTETAKLLEVRNGKIDQLSQIADQMQHLRDSVAHLQSDIEKLDFALTVLNPNHVPMDAKSSTSGRLLIDAQPHQIEEPQPVEASASQGTTAVVEEVATPKRRAKATTKGKVKKTAAAKPVTAKKAATTRKAKSEPVPQTAVDAAEAISGTRSRSTNEKELRARQVINGYMTDIKPADEIEAILKKGPKRGLTVEAIAEAFVKTHPLEDARNEVLMILKNRISSNISHLMKKGVVGKGKPEGESLTHYFFQKKGKATPAKAAPAKAAEPVVETVETPVEPPAEQVA
ncbi:hypothetical protein [Rhizobium sp. MHM7A]|uniref:hypothetical protein n=1 Tax=Rhizobium sp. MHM7A TaxID=2583233 RepID=UPI001105F3F8|nr:hypothetical protein [Rhizobium sp. MHM7A]TLX16403.1 hypothetical protein FFR93_03460 [Rhizobium sp. MHM7A]